MLYSDNLYSADTDDDGDNESFSNELSPTDGFFNRSPMAPNALVPDPSLDRKDATQEDKVLIPRSETRTESGGASRSTTSPTLGELFPSQNYASSQSNTRPTPSRSSNTPSLPASPTSPASYRRTDNTIFSHPVPSMQGPPPAYTPSSPIIPSSSIHNRSYSTIQPHQLEQGLPSENEPQSMGTPDEEPNETTPLSNRTIRKPSRRRAFITKLLFIALVITVVMGIMSTLASWGSSISRGNPNAPGEKLPEGTKPPDIGLPDSSSGSYCTSATIHNDEVFFDFALDKNLVVLQETHDPDYGSNSHSVMTSGEVRVRRLPKNSKYGTRGLVQIDTHVSDERLQVVKKWEDSSRTMRVSVPTTASFPGSSHCISLEITLGLPETTSLSSLSIGSTVLDLRVFDDIKLKVTGKSDFLSVSGNIFFPEHELQDSTTYPLDSRHITVETVSGNIKGIYPLYDYLKLASQSGDISAGVYPQAVLPSEPAPADLEISTSSGDIQVNLPAQLPGYSPPARDYVTHVGSVSGEIGGSYFLGSIGSLKTTSGDIKATILPVIQYSPSTDPDDAPKTQFQTWGMSGDQTLEIMDPVFISLLPSNKLVGPSVPDVPPTPDAPPAPPAPPAPKNPEYHHSQEPYVPIGDKDPYRDILPPVLNEDANLVQDNDRTMVKRRRVVKVWRTLTASHESTSGEIKVHYPGVWEGNVSGRTVSGDIAIDGKGLKMISYRKGWAFKDFLARKGVSKKDEGSSVTMGNISGDLKFTVGEVE